ncbi:MAG TPA: DUF882 domain-containing protein [Polyangiaceae bacterium]
MAAVSTALFAGTLAREPRVPASAGLARRKEDAGLLSPAPLLATLVQTHTPERVPLDRAAPPQPRFDALLSDRVTGAHAALDPRLLDLLRTLVAEFPAPDGSAPSLELVSGFRSPKLNEMLRKKGHHVATHSQHSLGHAVDFRIVVPCLGTSAVSGPPGDAACEDATAMALDPRILERAIRASGWAGGVGVYTSKDDWFVHADVGPNRSWFEGPHSAEANQSRR